MLELVMHAGLTLSEFGNFTKSTRVETQLEIFKCLNFGIFRVQNLVDEKLGCIFMVCYENFPQHPYYLHTGRTPPRER